MALRHGSIEPLYELPEGSGGDNLSEVSGFFRWLDRPSIEITIALWRVPNTGEWLTCEAHMICPHCAHPMTVRVNEQSCTVDGEGRLTLRYPFACPGHWPLVRNGMPVMDARTGAPAREACRWQGTVLGGQAHYCEVVTLPDRRVAFNLQRSCPALSGAECQCERGYRQMFGD